MRWNKYELPIGASRERAAFLLLPKCIRKEWRWLEYCRWEEYCYYWGWSGMRWLE